MLLDRLSKLKDLMEQTAIQAVAFNASSQLKYLTGLDFHLSERPVLFLLTLDATPALFFPEFEREKAESAGIDLELYAYGEDPSTWVESLSPALKSLKHQAKSIAVPPESMRYLELDLLQRAVGHSQFLSAAGLLKNLLICKDEEEIQNIRHAVSIAEQAIKSLLREPLAGQTEMEIANKLVICLLESGSEPNLPFNPIVASGPNSANPHAVPGSRMMQAGDLVVIDWGAAHGGYISDITRTFQIRDRQSKFEEIASIVLKANQLGREAVQPGILASSIDDAARKVIADAGFGRYFTHRTGHGIGMLAHEEPYISNVSKTELAPGMVFTVEPGIYLPGEGGVRIEDNVLVTENGYSTLTSLPRELKLVD